MNHISKALRGVADKYNGVSLIIRIIVGLIAGTALALVVPHMTWIGEFGTLFVSALKAVAPILVFVLVASALAQGNSKLDGRFGTVLFLYLFTTFLSAVVAVLTSRMFPQTISLGDAADADVVPHMGWDTVEAPEGSVLMKGVEGERFYFVHSFAAMSAAPADTSGDQLDFGDAEERVTWCTYGRSRFVAAYERGPLFATQFHPEKSAEAGSQLLRNWIATF